MSRPPSPSTKPRAPVTWIPRAAALLLASTAIAATPPAARAEKPHHHSHHTEKTPSHAAAATEPAGEAARLPVRVVATQHAAWGRLTFELGGNTEPSLRVLPDGIELHFATGTELQTPATTRLHQVARIETHDATDGPIAVVHLACDCAITTDTAGTLLRLDIRENPRHAGGKPASAAEAGEMDKLRDALAAKIAMLNAPPQKLPAPPPGSPAAAGAASAAAPAQPPAPVCLPPVDMTSWHSGGDFVARLTALRAQVAHNHAAAPDMADLAEFYLANALGAEALAVAGDALGGEASPEQHLRLVQDADVARLLKGEQLDPASPLLASAADCEGTDTALWHALAAAAAHDAEGAAKAADGARIALRRVPEPLLQRLAFRIAGAVGDDQAALLAMAGAVRNTTTDTPEDEAARFLLQARIAQFAEDKSDYAAFLERAAQYGMTAPGVMAKARLAALQVTRDGPETAHAAEVLADIARTYRFEPIGQQAAEHYAEHCMDQGDYGSALAIADESAGPNDPNGARTGASSGAVLAARILRILLVDPDKPGLPSPAERLALYWRYQGYTTPGDKGDDIRIGAARLMLAQRVPDAALTVLRQVTDGTAARPDVVLLRADAEARAGDPAVALAMLQTAPDNAGAHRVAADALERMGRFADAAHRLDGTAAVADKQRRAGLLFHAAAWSDAAAAYADVLGTSGLDDAARDTAAERYALALTLAGAAPPAGAPKLPEQPALLLGLLQRPAAASPPRAAAAPPRPGPASAAAPDAAAPQGATAPPSASPDAAAPPAADAPPALHSDALPAMHSDALPAMHSDALPAMRSALDRARRIEKLLDPAIAKQGS
jgi:hypothetical protein